MRRAGREERLTNSKKVFYFVTPEVYVGILRHNPLTPVVALSHRFVRTERCSRSLTPFRYYWAPQHGTWSRKFFFSRNRVITTLTKWRGFVRYFASLLSDLPDLI